MSRKRAIMVMYDSLNLHMLQTYGCDWTVTPNFLRLAQRSVCFENHYAGSLPCMPARRELHTGRMNFLHRSWGPMEPYDDSMPELLKNNGIYTHLVSDHLHYWEDGGATYHGRYSSWELARGQEGDPWKPDLAYQYNKTSVFDSGREWLKKPERLQHAAQDAVNRTFLDTDEKTPQAVTFQNGIDFIRRNHEEDRWFLQIETFDPHEPFYTLPEDRQLYPEHFHGDEELEADWPPYMPATESEEIITHVRYHYAALLSKCNRYLGRILDLMDEYQMWEDTMLIVNTDHGFLLGEHGYWGKSAMPAYEEIVHTPLFLYDPAQRDKAGERRISITQTIDLAPTLLSYFGVEIPKDMTGYALGGVIADDTPVREYAVFGYFGSNLNITDGRYLYMHPVEYPELPLYEYTLMPTHMRNFFSNAELQSMELNEPFPFTKGLKTLKIRGIPRAAIADAALYDMGQDKDRNVLDMHPQVVDRMKAALVEFLQKNDVPCEVYARMGLDA